MHAATLGTMSAPPLCELILRPQLLTLSLSAVKLAPSMQSALFGALLGNQSLTALSLRDVPITPSFDLLQEFIGKDYLQRLDLSWCGLKVKHFVLLWQTLAQKCRLLTDLSLAHNVVRNSY